MSAQLLITDSIYHFYSLLGNSTTIEGWEKDKAATMVRRGKILEVFYFLHNSTSRLLYSVFIFRLSSHMYVLHPMCI